MKKVLVVTLLLVAFTVPAFPQSQKDSKSNRGEAYLHFAKARVLAESGKVNEAIAEYKRALELDPDNPSIYAEMADSYLRAQPSRVRDALAAAQNAIKFDPNNIDAHKILASIYTSM